MRIELAGKVCEIPTLDVPTLRKIKQATDVPAADMDNYTFLYSVTAIAAGVSYSAASDLWRRHRAVKGAKAADLLTAKVATYLSGELMLRPWLGGAEWGRAFMEGR